MNFQTEFGQNLWEKMSGKGKKNIEPQNGQELDLIPNVVKRLLFNIEWEKNYANIYKYIE